MSEKRFIKPGRLSWDKYARQLWEQRNTRAEENEALNAQLEDLSQRLSRAEEAARTYLLHSKEHSDKKTAALEALDRERERAQRAERDLQAERENTERAREENETLRSRLRFLESGNAAHAKTLREARNLLLQLAPLDGRPE